ncbi:hypothetical protein PHISCL_07969 [Aspergillus sclerotialis]|uniref:CCHC-type domain-containing protein n=1 Tax=Aspergillus sclerotialis TaxID=2070753 RepID=A0A3A2ZJZ8_9EURO|nr:hypothetical protein PHISCL_07969 [Aspergillus sclerotialis]
MRISYTMDGSELTGSGYRQDVAVSTCVLQVWQHWPLCWSRSALRPSVSAITVRDPVNSRNEAHADTFPLTGKQPGHESSGCPRPRTTETKQCYNCQGLGHVQADCPTLRLNGASGRCYNCSQPGHLARSCPAPQGGRVGRGGFGGFRGGYGGYPRAATCYKCGGPNHFARDCQAQAMKCYACGKLGHISRDCTAPNGGPLSSAGKVCYKCSQAGHISRDCPNGEAAATQQPLDVGAAPAAEVGTDAAPVASAAPTTAVA